MYNNPFYFGYPQNSQQYPQISQQYPQNSQQYQSQQDERIWVQNEAAASAYLVAPNGFVRLWSASENVFYEKRADASGRPLPMECYTYSRKAESAPISASNTVPDSNIVERLDSLENRLRAIERREFLNESECNAAEPDGADTEV